MISSEVLDTSTPPPADRPGRLTRRKARTRAALVAAAQDLLAQGRTDVPILAITEAADVGLGSFYNHFPSREALFQAAVADALDAHGAALDRLLVDIDDPAEVFAASFRITGRFHRVFPQLSLAILHGALDQRLTAAGLARRARRDLIAGEQAGRFHFSDVDLAMVVVEGAALALGRLLHHEPGRDDAEGTDEVTEALLRALGVDVIEAQRLAHAPLPALERLAATTTGTTHPYYPAKSVRFLQERAGATSEGSK